MNDPEYLEIYAEDERRTIERELRNNGYHRIAGVDECGRGSLISDVVVAGVILPEYINMDTSIIKDSKKITSETRRENVYEQIIHIPGIQYAVKNIPPSVIDEINILEATLLGMKNVLEELNADYGMIDGNKIPDTSIPCQSYVKGDDRCLNIAAASIIAKVTRDRMMNEYDSVYPEWNFKKNKGYGTKEHMDRINQLQYGTEIHRLSFAPLNKYILYV